MGSLSRYALLITALFYITCYERAYGAIRQPDWLRKLMPINRGNELVNVKSRGKFYIIPIVLKDESILAI